MVTNAPEGATDCGDRESADARSLPADPSRPVDGPVRGAYLVDTGASSEGDGLSIAFWTGRLRHVYSEGSYLLVTATGYEWPVAPGEVRPASAAEREAYERNRFSGYLRPPEPEPEPREVPHDPARAPETGS